MLLRNLAHRALHDGRAVVVRTASDLLADLARQDSSVARARRLEAYVLTTNKAFAEWHTTFPNASCVVALVDRLINRADIVAIDGDSYLLHEAEERQKLRAAARKPKKERPPRSA